MKTGFLFFLLAVVWCVGSGGGWAEEAGPVSYRGFSFDDSAIADRTKVGEMRAAMQGQIDMVLAVGLPAEVVATLQKLPISIQPEGSFQSPTPGRFLARQKRVQLAEGFVRLARKPILLHEFMHGYHNLILADGVGNAQVLEFYARAKTLGVYAPGSHMMSNVNEFFACTTTAYLYSSTAQEPFTRGKVEQNQPVYFGFLQKLFGAEAGKYEGKL